MINWYLVETREEPMTNHELFKFLRQTSFFTLLAPPACYVAYSSISLANSSSIEPIVPGYGLAVLVALGYFAWRELRI